MGAKRSNLRDSQKESYGTSAIKLSHNRFVDKTGVPHRFVVPRLLASNGRGDFHPTLRIRKSKNCSRSNGCRDLDRASGQPNYLAISGRTMAPRLVSWTPNEGLDRISQEQAVDVMP
jgi:hypothetical protein